MMHVAQYAIIFQVDDFFDRDQLPLTPTNPIDRLFVFFEPRMTFFSGAAAFLGGIFFFTLAAADVVNVRRKRLLSLLTAATRKSICSRGKKEKEGRRSKRLLARYSTHTQSIQT